MLKGELVAFFETGCQTMNRAISNGEVQYRNIASATAPNLKAKVALVALSESKTLAEIASE
jgi:hypothetical protein